MPGKRTRLSRLEMLKVMVRQAICPRCGKKLGRLEDLQDDHIVPRGLGGGEELENRQLIHIDCHERKTNGGRAKATTAGSDIHAIAKAKRCAEANAEFCRRMATKGEVKDTTPRRRKIPSRPLRSRKTSTGGRTVRREG